MKLCVLNEFFHPDSSTGTGRVVSSIARTLRDRYGVDVTAIASQNPYRAGEVLAAAEDWDGIAIRRAASPDWNRKSTPQRFVGNSIFARRAFRLALLATPDVLLVTTAPPVLPAAAMRLKKQRGVPYVYIVYDLEPNRTLALGVVKEGALPARMLAKAQGEWLRGAAKVIAIGRCMAEIVKDQYGVPENRIAVVPVGSPPFDTADDGSGFRAKNGLEGFLAVYSGNFARYHEFETILAAAEISRKRANGVQFVLVGAGYQKEFLQREIDRRNLPNVKMLPFVSDAEYGGMLNGSDVCLVSLKAETIGTCVPSKFYTQLAAGRPTVAIMPERAEVARVLRESNSGLVVSPGDAQGLASTLEKLKNDPAELTAMGKRAAQEFELKYKEEIIVDQIYRYLEEAANRK